MYYAKSDGDDSAGRRDIKVVLDVRSDEDNIYDDEHYGDGKYFDDYHRARNVNNVPTVDLWNTNGETENDYSEPVASTLSESQERKRCARILGSAGGRPSGLGGYGLLESNGRPAGIQTGNARPGRINDDYLIKVLKQLIEKLHRNKTADSTRLSAVRKSSGPKSESTDGDPAAMAANISTSAEDEWIFKLEKTKGDRIIDHLNSSPEKTFVNGKWLRNKLAVGNDDCGGGRPAATNANYITGGTNVPKNDNRLIFDLKNPENQQVATAETDGHEYPTNGSSQTASGGGDAGKRPAENKEVSTSPSRPAAVDNQQHVLASRETAGPLYWSSTAKFIDSGTTVDDDNKRKYTTADTTDDDEEVDSVSDDYTPPPSPGPSVANRFPPTAQPTSDSNGALDANRPDRILESNVYENNDNPPTANYSEGPATATAAADSDSSVENERDPFGNAANGNGADCVCNKKIVKNVLSSIMIKNVTEIKTDTYPADTSLANKTNGYKRSNKSRTASESPAGRANVKRAKNVFADNGGGGSTTSKRPLTKFPSRDEIVAELKLKRLQFEERVKMSNENRRSILGKIKIKSEPTNSSDDGLRLTVRRKIAEKSTATFNPGKKDAGNVLGEKNTAANNIAANRKTSSRLDGSNKNSDVDNYSARNEPKATLGRGHAAKFGEKPAKNVKFERDDHVNSKTASNISDEYNHAGKATKRISSGKSSTPRLSTTETKKIPEKFLGDGYVTANRKTSGYPIGAGEIPGGNVVSRKNRQRDRDNYYSNGVKLTGKPTGLDGNADGGGKTTTPKRTKTKTADGNRRPTGNGELASKLTPKMSPANGGNAVINAPAALFFDGGSVAAEYDIPNKPTAVVRETGGPKSKFNSGRVLSKPKPTKTEPHYRTADEEEYDDPEHGPYKAGDLIPIVFDGQTPAGRKSSSSTGSGRSDGVQRASSPSGGYNDDGNTNRENASSVTVVDGDGDIVSDYDNRRNPVDHKPWILNNQSRFDVLHRVKVADGVFKIPLVSHSAVDANGSAHVSDIFIPIVKHDGRHTAVSLTELLAGDFQLSQDDDVGSPSSAGSTLRQSSTVRSGNEQYGRDVDGGMTDVADGPTSVLHGTVDDILQRAGGDGAEKTPVQIIQIINNGLCLDRCNVTTDKAANAKAVRDPNSAVVAKARNEGNKPRPVLSSPNLRQTRRKIGNAYNHFDSEILDRFLQVYTP
ncbi:Hypothetical protein CINCED_3A002921 [Cinara cedri]|uniref:Uncharacterized protein n=1 Tax=Cinara cedri TaxID=506608 RepID=A0A5E4N755_9HEMI|nr:Hypothetical protein CINCED_3A002921 [Cinara cedri]